MKHSPNGNIEFKLKLYSPFTPIPSGRSCLEAAKLFEFEHSVQTHKIKT